MRNPFHLVWYRPGWGRGGNGGAVETERSGGGWGCWRSTAWQRPASVRPRERCYTIQTRKRTWWLSMYLRTNEVSTSDSLYWGIRFVSAANRRRRRGRKWLWRRKERIEEEVKMIVNDYVPSRTETSVKSCCPETKSMISLITTTFLQTLSLSPYCPLTELLPLPLGITTGQVIGATSLPPPIVSIY